jgi:hypothetical protein
MRASGDMEWNLIPEIARVKEELVSRIGRTFENNPCSIEHCIILAEAKVRELRTF